MRLLKAVIAVAFLICPLAAKADSLDFHAINPGGVSWAGGISSLTASSSNVSRQIIPGGSSMFLPGSVLSFTTGAYMGGWPGVLYSFASGGNITVSGCGSTCFSGNFTQGALLFGAAGGTATFVGNFIAGQLDSSFFGSPSGAVGSISASFANVSLPSAGGSLTGDWASGDLTLTPVPNPVPEPPAIALLGFGLIGLALLAKK